MDCPVTGRRTGGCVHNVSDHPETAIDHGRPLQFGLASGKIRENLNRKPMGFYHQIWGFPVKIFPSSSSMTFTIWIIFGLPFRFHGCGPLRNWVTVPEKNWRLTRDIDRSPVLLVSMQLSEYLSNVGSAQVYFSFQVWQF